MIVEVPVTSYDASRETDHLTGDLDKWCTGLISPPPDQDYLPNHDETFHSPATREAIELVPAGGKLAHIVPGYGSNYRRLRSDRPSWTVTATCYSDLIHPEHHRLLTPRELARLQTFPDQWRFMGPRRGGQGRRLVAHIFAQIGNAVPPLLAYHIARHIREHMRPQERTVISLFSGAGGLDLGFEAAGFHVRACVEKDRHAVETLRTMRRAGRKLGLHSFLRDTIILPVDIFELSAERLMRAARLEPGKAALLIGGPPCQPFSIAGERHGLSDHRGHLVDEYLRIVRYVDPQCIVFENVPGIRSVDNGSVLAYLKAQLSSMNYHVEEHVLNAADYGVPQIRTRVFLFGCKSRAIGAPTPTHAASNSLGELFAYKRLPHRTVSDAISSLPPATSGGATARKIAATIKARKEKQDWTKLLKRKHSIRPDASVALQPFFEALRMIAFPERFITLFSTTWLLSFTTHDLTHSLTTSTNDRSLSEVTALARELSDGDLPETTRDAFNVLGARPLLQAGILTKSPSSPKEDPTFQIETSFLKLLSEAPKKRDSLTRVWRERVAEAF